MERVCPVCGKPVDGRPDKIYCSRECKGVANYKRKNPFEIKTRTCLICGKTYQTYKKSTRYCSDECRERATQIREDARRKRAEQRPCEYCGKMFVPRNSKNVTCSPECSTERRRKQSREHWRELKKAGIPHIRNPQEKKKKANTTGDILRIAREAAEHHMSYGQYVAVMERRGRL